MACHKTLTIICYTADNRVGGGPMKDDGDARMSKALAEARNALKPENARAVEEIGPGSSVAVGQTAPPRSLPNAKEEERKDAERRDQMVRERYGKLPRPKGPSVGDLLYELARSESPSLDEGLGGAEIGRLRPPSPPIDKVTGKPIGKPTDKMPTGPSR